ncbi:MAG: hypothetical protein ACRENU_13895 [Gemmatimonadaceae bacterium]
MWRTDTYWFDVAVITTLLMLGHLFFGRFTEHQPRWRKLLKSVVGIVLIVGTSVWFGRAWSWVFMGAIAVAVIVVHGWWLPRNGVNGWTGEPKARYYELLGLDAQGRPRKSAG